MKLLTAHQMRELDRRAIEEAGIPGMVLMENAGRGAADLLGTRFAERFPGPVLVVCGKGNNGGDGYVLARHLTNRGWRVRTLVLAPQAEIGGDAGLNLQILVRSGGEVTFAPDGGALAAALAGQEDARLAVDALFGTGLASEVRGHYRQAIDWLNGRALPVLALDLPSGVDADTGRIHGAAVRADLTVTFAFPKVGHVVFPGADFAGELALVDIGIPAAWYGQVPDLLTFVDAAAARLLLPARPATGHKGTFGHLLVVAGSTGKAGAAALAGEGGLRAGAGLVTVAVPRSEQPVLAAKLTEAMTVPLAETAGAIGLEAWDELEALWAGKQALALGPGLGTARETAALVRRLMEKCPLPLVLDADGLNALEGHLDVLGGREAFTVLTPHPGEMARLTGRTVAEIELDRIAAARDFAETHRVVLVLKGARTVTAWPDGQIRINGSGNSGMASGGMGDALTGLIGGLLAQGLAAPEAASLGVFLHGLAGDRLARRLGDAGLLATDLLREIPAARHQLRTME
jgi:NAD(P)H-hydrate epimerase